MTPRKIRKKVIEKYKQTNCALCSSKENLQFHHVFPKLKSFDIQSGEISVPQAVLENEISKCVILCSRCHGLLPKSKNPSSGIKNKKLYYDLRDAIDNKTIFVPVP